MKLLKIILGSIAALQIAACAGEASNENIARVNVQHKISAGYIHACAIKTNGTVVCWGDNRFSQLGDGITYY